MTRRLVAVHGTHGLDEVWWRHDGALVKAFGARGIPALNAIDPFFWSGHVQGFDSRPEDWEAGGAALRWYVEHYRARAGSLVVVAHSHGGQIAAYAAAQGMYIDTLVTVATPVRKDLDAIYAAAKPNTGRWIHIHSDVSDRWQWLGELFDGRLGVYRTMPMADVNIRVPGVGHAGLLNPAVWDMAGVWQEVVAHP